LSLSSLAGAALKPDEFHVERSAVINAPPPVVFEHVNDLHKWQAWSPWVKMDPKATTTFAGPNAGRDAAMSWDGKKTGKDTMTITESRPAELVVFRLDFEKPFKGTDTAQFTFAPENGSTKVTWSMDGHQNYMMKVVGLVMNCDKMMGGAFEDGLASLKAVSETP